MDLARESLRTRREENYQMAFEDPTIGTSLLISVSATILSIVLGLIVTALAAYALSIKTLPGRSLMNFFWYFTDGSLAAAWFLTTWCCVT